MMTQYNDITRFFTILSFLLLIGCQSKSINRQRNGDVRFKTTAPSLIYFKNIKSIKYQSYRNPKSQMDFYRPKAFMKTTNTPIIYPVIVHNWLEDESYLIFEKKNINKETMLWATAETGDTILLNWPSSDYIKQLEFVKKLEEVIKSEENILMETPNQEKKLLKFSPPEQISFTMVVQDFLNLTETERSRKER